MIMDNLLEKLSSSDVITSEDMSAILEFSNYGSLGMLNYIVDCLTVVRDKVYNGIVVTYKDDNSPNDVVLTKDNFMEFIKEHVQITYVIRELSKTEKDVRDVFFSLKNTEEGFDLVYNGVEQSKLVKWIANISETYALVYLRMNGVVYIQNRNTLDIVPMVSEHNNYYVFDKETSKIKEVM